MKTAALTAALAAMLLPLSGWPETMGDDLEGGDEQVARFEVCFNFGCSSRKRIYLFETEWREVSQVMRGAGSAADERERIARAIGVMERLVGEVSPTGADRAGNGYVGQDPHGQLDCVDESPNATTYLRLFQAQGLLRWHRVE